MCLEDLGVCGEPCGWHPTHSSMMFGLCDSWALAQPLSGVGSDAGLVYQLTALGGTCVAYASPEPASFLCPSPFYRHRNQGPERFHILLRITQGPYLGLIRGCGGAGPPDSVRHTFNPLCPSTELVFPMAFTIPASSSPLSPHCPVQHQAESVQINAEGISSPTGVLWLGGRWLFSTLQSSPKCPG